MHVHRIAKSTPWPSVQIGAIRLHDAEYVSWASIERKPGKWDFAAFDKNVDEAQRHQTQILYTLGQTPTWAANNKSADSSYGLAGSSSPPASLEIWRRYIRTVVRRYKGKIAQYEIWNEASAPNFYSGTMQQLLDLCRVAYEEIKREDPQAIVLSPSGTGDDGLKWFDNFLFSGGGRYCDVISYHFYHKGMKKDPENIAYMVKAVRDSMKRYSVDKPLWDTECFYGPDAPSWDASSAAKLIPRAFLMRWLYGIERFYYYSWDNFRNGLQMLTPELETASAARAFAQTQNWLVGKTMVSCERNKDGVWIATLAGGPDKRSRIVWAQYGERILRGITEKTMQKMLGPEANVPVDKQVVVSDIPILLRP